MQGTHGGLEPKQCRVYYPIVCSSLGSQLRFFREQRKLTLFSVAEVLKLPVRLLKSLEDDRWQAEIPYGFVKGYIKQYAKLLGVDAASLVALIPKNHMPQLRTIERLNFTVHLSSTEVPKRLLQYGGVCCCILGCLLYLPLACLFR